MSIDPGNYLIVDMEEFKNPLWSIREEPVTVTKHEVQEAIYETFYRLFEAAEATLNPISRGLLYWLMAAWLVYTEHGTGLKPASKARYADISNLYDMLTVYQDIGLGDAPVETWEQVRNMPEKTVEQRRQKRAVRRQLDTYIERCYYAVEPLGFDLIKSRIEYKDCSEPILLAFCLGLNSCQLSVDLGQHFAAMLPRAASFPVLEQYYPEVRKWKRETQAYGSQFEGYAFGAKELAEFLGAN